MKIASFVANGEAGYGVVIQGHSAHHRCIIPADTAFRAKYPTLKSVLAGGALGELAGLASSKVPVLREDEVVFLPPVPDACKIICIGVNYPKRHPVDGDVPPPEHIFMFSKFHDALVGHRETLDYPSGEAGQTFDYEGELVLVIGKPGRDISTGDALDHVAGYTIMNDGSVRGWQAHSVPAGKNFYRSGACGPWMVSADEITDPFALRLSTRLNGEEVQSTTVDQMIFDLPSLISYVSHVTPLGPGDLIATGSPDGAGGSRIPQRFLKPGDRLEIEWSGVGVLENVVGKSA